MWEFLAAGMTALVLILVGLIGVIYKGISGTVDKLSGSIDKLEETIKGVEDGSREALTKALESQTALVTKLREELSGDIKDHEKKLFSLAERLHEGQGALLEIKNQMAREYMPVEDIKERFDKTDTKFDKIVASIEEKLKPLPEMSTKLVLLTAKVDEVSRKVST